MSDAEKTITRAVRFYEYGDIDVLKVEEVPTPVPQADEVLVEVRAAGINPGETGIRVGALKDMFPSTFPSGQGSDLAGVVVGLGAGVTEFALGDEVLGFSWTRSSQATHAAVPVSQLVSKPAELSWTIAGSLYVAGVTAFAAVRAVGVMAGDVVAVSAAAGGVGSIVTQLLVARGATVLGIASEANARWLEAHGATPITYGDGLEQRLREAAPNGVDALIDLHGPEYLDLALALGIAPDRIETIISFPRAEEIGAKAEGSSDASTPEVLTEMAGLVAAGAVEIPVASIYPLEDVKGAFTELENGHTHGKIVLVP